MNKVKLKLSMDRATHVSGAYAEFLPEAGRGELADRVDISAVIAEHTQGWMVDVDRWHTLMSRLLHKKCRNWPYNDGSRLTIWAPYDFRPLFFSRAIYEVCASRKFTQLTLYGVTDEIGIYLEEWTRQSECPYILTGISTSARKKSTNFWALAALALYRDARKCVYLLSRWKPFELRSDKPTSTSILISSLPLKPKSEHGDHFFGTLFDGNEYQGKVTWIYDDSGSVTQPAIRKSFRDQVGSYFFLFDDLRLVDIIDAYMKAIGESFQMAKIFGSVPALSLGGVVTACVNQRIYETTLSNGGALIQRVVRRLMGRIISAVSPKVLLYPFEQKGVERAIIDAAKATKSDLRVCAYAHAVFCDGHMYLKFRSMCHLAQPDLVLVAGQLTLEWLCSHWGWPREKVLFVGSSRHLDQPTGISTDSKPSVRRNVLFLTGVGHEISRLCEFVSTVPDLFRGYNLTVRKYPFDWIRDQQNDIRHLRELGVNLHESELTLKQDIESADVILYISTSASIEAMQKNKVCIRITDALVDTDPLNGRDTEQAVSVCRSGRDLDVAIQEVFSLSVEDYIALAQKQLILANGLYAAWSQEAFNELLMERNG